ncbi:DUF397 domain-containing protein [Spirillospora sp. NPDC048819]|uniref:DUF397 domain-containing protein n=1 Tax=Spirillospora sp. NPDC048819 TaxID=3155268 RepID=UPI0033C67484
MTAPDPRRATWRKSSRSNGGEGGCVEVADNLPGVVAVRDSKDPDGPVLTFAAATWRGFVESVKDERFGL